ncbi:MAG: DUF1559 domain-containing protein [Planctomycetota bacterium]
MQIQPRRNANRIVGPSRAFTLIEVITVIAIIGLLVAIMLPAVQATRETARRSTCQVNLRNQALAVNLFVDGERCFPAGCVGTRALHHSWCSKILPFLEQNALAEKFDWNKPWDDPGGNREVAQNSLSVFRCPSSLYEAPGDIDYGGIIGSGATGAGPHDIFRNGILKIVNTRDSVMVRPTDVIDGLSYTILIGESADRDEIDHGKWADGWNCMYSGGTVNAEYGELASHHPRGIHVAMADGSVRFLVETTARNVVGALCTRNGCERVDEDSLNGET